MDDTQLLEDAARAIGRSITGWNTKHGVAVACLDDDTFWQPQLENHITDCMGDALRLAVKLRMRVNVAGAMTAVVYYTELGADSVKELFGSDMEAATRRAITRAAAEIGRAMKEGEPSNG